MVKSVQSQIIYYMASGNSSSNLVKLILFQTSKYNF